MTDPTPTRNLESALVEVVGWSKGADRLSLAEIREIALVLAHHVILPRRLTDGQLREAFADTTIPPFMLRKVLSSFCGSTPWAAYCAYEDQPVMETP